MLVGRILGANIAFGDAGIVDEDIDMAMLLDDFGAALSTSFDFVTSSVTPLALRPSFSKAATLDLTRSGIISATTTVAPASPKACAQAKPMPCPPPVTTATRPSSFNFSMYISFSFQLIQLPPSTFNV